MHECHCRNAGDGNRYRDASCDARAIEKGHDILKHRHGAAHMQHPEHQIHEESDR